MNKELLRKINIILVEPRYQGNIGSVARAMKNMGLEKLILVNPSKGDSGEAAKMAYGAHDILQNAETFETLKEVVAPMSFAIGTTRRFGKSRGHFLNPKEAAFNLVSENTSRQCAIVFGREDKGLTSEELALCRFSAAIPTGDLHQSLNLAQSVMIFAYEIFIASGIKNDNQSISLAGRNEIEKMYEHIKETLVNSGFLNRGTPERFMRRFRKIFERGGLEERDVRVIRGICSQLNWMADKIKNNKDFDIV
ncbi:MAG: RNA methyltransferase [Candidatus Theseobacter exili]|nr:RNA methyltransferase [Candidatus Theseobacter exili]